ncbi:ATP-binding cassette domain-containing protein [Paenibacillus sp. GP183]|uniref:ATP-binding cassette domain-containing protein n=1 Tax=Paenibacillus sp. GP183 TaxID=1882751 RepID=UPI00089727D5|nr:ATP-binding cassette domain-containing protein [Paenibacillus sp. GP183]SEB52541.1 ATP-binding cassette, subfamily B [Paenibacillus sp. GP183]
MKRLIAFLVLQYAKYGWKSVLILFLMMFTLTYEITFSLSFKYLIDNILIPRKIEILTVFLFVLIAGAVASSLSDLIKDHLLIKIGVQVQNDLRHFLFSHLQSLSVSYYKKTAANSIHSRFTTDVNQIHASFLSFQTVVYSLAGLLISTIFLATLNWRFSLLTLFGIPLCFLLPRFLNKKATEANETYRTKENYGQLLLESVENHEIIRTYGLRDWEYQRMKSASDRISPLWTQAQFLNKLMHNAVTKTLVLLNMLIIAVGAFLTVGNVISVGMLVAFQSFYIGMSRYAASLTQNLPQFVSATISLKRIDAVLAEKPSEEQDLNKYPSKAIRFSEGIHLKQVFFGYTPERKALKNINMSLPALSYCAVVGKSGSGKSSLISLLLRFYEPDQGSILMDGIDVKEISVHSFRALTGYVPQEITLFNMSIGENIRIGKPDADNKEVESAARAAGIHEWIISVPNGYDSIVGERGQYLSGGQKQRIAIARALLREPDILVLDEATSSLDPDTEMAIHETIHQVSSSKTIISVTHRLHTARGATRIFVMNDGEMVDSGTHEELLEKSDIYRSIWAKQSGFKVSSDGRDAGITLDRLKQIPLFMELDDDVLEDVQKYMMTENFNPGVTVIEQGAPGDWFYIIVRGKVEVLHSRDMEESRRIAVLEDGDHFGEIALLKQIPRTATIRTLTLCTFLKIHRDMFQIALEKSPFLREQLEASYQQRLERTHSQAVESEMLKETAR